MSPRLPKWKLGKSCFCIDGCLIVHFFLIIYNLIIIYYNILIYLIEGLSLSIVPLINSGLTMFAHWITKIHFNGYFIFCLVLKPTTRWQDVLASLPIKSMILTGQHQQWNEKLVYLLLMTDVFPAWLVEHRSAVWCPSVWDPDTSVPFRDKNK